MRISRRDLLQGVGAIGAAVLGSPANAGLHFHGTIPLYEGLVASRARMIINTAPDTTNKFLMARAGLIATETLTSIKIAFANFLSAGSGDIGVGASASITASVEYPAGTFTQVLFSASSAGTIPNNSVLFSDYLTVNIPSGATFWVRTFWNSSAGTLYNTWQNTFFGEATALSPTSITDQTMSGTITNSGAFSYPPIAVLGMTINASVIILGDSIDLGILDSEDSSSTVIGRNGKVGVIARSLGSTPFLIMAASGERASGWLSGAGARALLIQKSSHIASGHGTNDIFGSGSSEASLIIALNTLWALCRADQKIFQRTLIPRNNSSDGWLTLVNQSQISAGTPNAVRVAFNTDLRAGTITAANLKGFFDVASVLESGLNSGNWLVTPAPPYTSDGTHPNVAGNALVPGSGVVSPVVWP